MRARPPEIAEGDDPKWGAYGGRSPREARTRSVSPRCEDPRSGSGRRVVLEPHAEAVRPCSKQRALRVLQDHALDDVGHVLAAVGGVLEVLVDLLPLDDGDGVLLFPE